MNNLQWKGTTSDRNPEVRKRKFTFNWDSVGSEWRSPQPRSFCRWDAHLRPTPGAEDSPFNPAMGLAHFNTSCLSSSRAGGTPSFFLPLFPLAKVELVPLQALIARLQGGMWVRRTDAVTAIISDGTRKEEASRDVAAGWQELDF